MLEPLKRERASGGANDDANVRDRTALPRIIKQFPGTLGFLWAESDQEIVITDAGFAMIAALANDEPLRPVVEQQAVKLQYPHPLLPRKYRENFGEEVEQHEERLSEEESAEITRLQIEKAIESAYADNPELLHMLEAGLQLVGRQVETPIGRIDLLCRGSDGKYVVVEIKAKGAEDSVFGQILRYIGWIHSNYPDESGNVRGIILASQFLDKARYSRIGLLKPDAEQFLQFHRPRFAVDKV